MTLQNVSLFIFVFQIALSDVHTLRDLLQNKSSHFQLESCKNFADSAQACKPQSFFETFRWLLSPEVAVFQLSKSFWVHRNNSVCRSTNCGTKYQCTVSGWALSENFSCLHAQSFIRDEVSSWEGITFSCCFLFQNQALFCVYRCDATDLELSNDECDMQILATGSSHQGDIERFPPHSVGRQCVMNSVTFLINCNTQDPSTIACEDLDRVLFEGDRIYRNMDHRSDALMSFADIPKLIKAFKKQFQLQTLLEGHVSLQNKEGMHKLLNRVLNDHSDVVVILGDGHSGSAVALRKEVDFFTVFDPHSRSSVTGLPSPDGQCVLVLLPALRDLTTFLQQLGKCIKMKQMSVAAFAIDPLPNFTASLHANTSTDPTFRRR